MTQQLLKGLTAAQTLAVETIDGPVLVIAGPGTGKTQLLAQRAANILLKTDVQPQNILCLTYTEAATRNMRERMGKYMGKHAYDVTISTYHGFGSEIIRDHREFFLEHNAQQPIDNLLQHQILEEIYQTISSNNTLWRKETYLKDVLHFIGEAKKAGLMPKDIRSIAKDNTRSINSLNKYTKKDLALLTKMSKSSISLFEKLFIDTKSLPASTKKLPIGITSLDTQFITALAEAYIEAEATNRTVSLTAFKNNWLTKDKDDKWVVKGTNEVAKLLGAADIYEQYLKKLKDNNLYDYDDMILLATKAIEDHSELRFSLQEKYQYIMLDEFQDTNKAQLKLIELLTNNPVNEGRPNILAVGDDDQAIFSFQGAEVDNMLRFYKLYKNVNTITLTENWRSHQNIIDTAQYVSNQIEKRLHSKLGLASKDLLASNKALPAQAKIEQHQFISDVAELDWVAKKVKELIDKGQSPEGIAILAPKHKYLEPLVPFLEQKNIPLHYEKRENVLEDQYIARIINMLKLINSLSKNNYPKANELWPEILTGSEWQIPTSLIWQLSWQSSENKYKEDATTNWLQLMLAEPSLKPIALFFAKLATISGTETLEKILDYCIGIEPLELNEPDIPSFSSPFYKYYFDSANAKTQTLQFTQLLSHLTVLRQRLREHSNQKENILYLKDALDFIDSYNNAAEKLLNTSPYHTAADAVQLITAYSAKGLEFDVVFVLATTDDVWGMKARGASSNIILPKNLQTIRFAGAQKDEKKRLFYVALTRAKHTLYLTSFTKNYAGKPTTELEFISQTKDDNNFQKNMPKLVSNLHTDDALTPNAKTLQLFWQTHHYNSLDQPNLIELLKPRLQDFQLSATHLNSFTDMELGGPEQFFVNTILRFPKAPSANGEYGSAIHESIEAIANMQKNTGELPVLEEIQDIFAKKLSKKTLNKNEYIQYLNRGEKALAAFMQWWWPNFSIQNQAEVRFKHEGSFCGKAHLTGNLDYLVIDHENQDIQVVDYKTGHSFTSWAKSTKSHKYKQQLLFYKILLNSSHTYKNYKISQGRVVFVEPEENDKMTDLSLNYSDADISRTKQLIKAIWNRITLLDFPDTSGFSKNIKGTLEFEDWLINNTKI